MTHHPNFVPELPSAAVCWFLVGGLTAATAVRVALRTDSCWPLELKPFRRTPVRISLALGAVCGAVFGFSGGVDWLHDPMLAVLFAPFLFPVGHEGGSWGVLFLAMLYFVHWGLWRKRSYEPGSNWRFANCIAWHLVGFWVAGLATEIIRAS